MPLSASLLLGAELVILRLQVKVLALLGADGADLRVGSTQFAFRVEDGMDMKT